MYDSVVAQRETMRELGNIFYSGMQRLQVQLDKKERKLLAAEAEVEELERQVANLKRELGLAAEDA
jgi:cell division protein FtsB